MAREECARAGLATSGRPSLGEDPPGFLNSTGLTTDPIYAQDLAVWLPARVFWEVEAIGVAVDQGFGHRADPASHVATLAGVVLFVVLAAVTLVPLVFWLRSGALTTVRSS